MDHRKLSPQEFARAVKNGLGSAMLHIAAYSDEGVEEELLYACVHNQVYDQQADSGRALWLTRMISRTKRIDYYVHKVKEAIHSLPEDESDFDQLAWIAANLIQLGFDELRSTLLFAFEKVSRKRRCPTDYFTALVNTFGIAGLTIAARKMPEIWPDEIWDMSFLAEHAIEYFHKNNIEEVFGENAKTDAQLRAFIEIVNNSKMPPFPSVELPPLSLTDVINTARAASDYGLIQGLTRFGQKADEAELIEILHRLEEEENPFCQMAYLSVFTRRPLPQINDRLLRLIHSPHHRVRQKSLHIFSRINHSVLRAETLKCLESQDEIDIAAGVRLLEANYKPGDSELLERSIIRLKQDEHLHQSQFALNRLANDWPAEGLTSSLLRLIEYGPCGYCRISILEALISRRAAPVQLLFEAQWDANDEVRYLARSEYNGSLLTRLST